MEVKAFVEATITVELEGVENASFTRCITFVFGGNGGDTPPSAPISTVVTFTDKKGTANLTNVPACVDWTCITAKDRLHTLSSKVALSTSGGKYTASFEGTDKLIGGDLTDDNMIDILDFGAFSGKWGQTQGKDTTCATVPPTRHADISGNATVGVEDFSFIQIHFVTTGDLACGNAASVASVGAGPRSSVSVRELAKIIGLRDAANADVNRDGIVDMTDVKLFLQQRMSK